MIHYKGKLVSSVFHKAQAVSIIYHMAKVVWQAVRSCFGAGIWRSDKPWLGDDKWKSNT